MHRHFLRGSYGEYIAALFLFLVLTIVYTNFVIFNISHQLFVDSPGDATAGFLWLNFADPGISPFLSDTKLVNYPFGEKMGGATFVTYLALWLPMRIFSYFFGAVAGLNIMMVIGFVGSAMGGYWLLKRLTGSMSIALLAGIAIAFVPYHLYKSSAHLAYIFSIVFVLILAGFLALWVRPTKLRACLFGVAIAVAFYTDGYYLLIATVMVFGLVLSGILHGLLCKFTWKDYRVRFVSLFLSLATLLLLMIPVGYVQLTQGDKVQETLSSSRSNIAEEIKAYQSKLMDFILPSATNPLFQLTGDAKVVDDYKNLRSNRTENMTYLGFVVLTLVSIGVVLVAVWVFLRKHSSLHRIKRPVLNAYILTGCIVIVTTPLFLSFMLSPSITIHGHVIELPGQLLIDHNLALWRVMSRFFIPLHVVLVVFATFTLWVVLQISRRQMPNRYVRLGIVLALTALLLVEYTTGIYRPSFDFNNSPEAYQWLSRQKDIATIAEFPMVDPLDAHTTRYVTYQVVHKKNLVNFKEPNKNRLTNILGSLPNTEAVDFAYNRGAEAIIVHDRTCLDVDWGTLIHKSKDDNGGDMCIYRLRQPVTSDQLFGVYDKGFKYYPNLPNVEHSLASFEQMHAEMIIVDKSLKRAKTQGRANLKATIRDFHNDKVDGIWSIKQAGVTLAEGRISNSSSMIDVDVDISKNVEFDLRADEGVLLRPNDLSLNDLVVTQLQ
jgi:hypothetical protein